MTDRVAPEAVAPELVAPEPVAAEPVAAEPVAIVTGASSGIGESTVRRLAGKGYAVYGAARRVDRMQPLADAGVHVRALDVTDDGSMRALVDEIVAEHGRIDVLVNNAGYGSYGALEDVPIAEARRQFDVNVFGLARMTQLVLPHMRARRDGYIVNVSSIGGKIWEPLGSWYHATKFAVEGLSDSLRAEVAGFGVKVIVIEPGAIHTEWGGIAADNVEANSAGTSYQELAKHVGSTLRAADNLPLSSDPDVVARTIVKAVSRSRPRTRYPTGGGARSILFAKRLMPDRVFDHTIRTAYRVTSKLS
ncbi:MAG TPA: oxidoreductase [Acidimicrobiia bacterium]|jgi:NAD(P)-dependent dehydrogenase (short-subunit alcohol dehydrogenase family)